MHKLSICLKELRESHAWIRLIIQAELLSAEKMSELLDESEELCRIVAQSIITTKANQKKK